MGIGCACEEAVRIILESDLNFKLEEKNDPAGDDCDDEADEKMLNFVFTLREELFKLFSNKKISTSRKLTIYLNVCSELQDVLNSEEFVTEDKDYKNLIKDTIDNVTFDVKHKPAYKDDISAEIEEILMAFFEGFSFNLGQCTTLDIDTF